VQNLLLMVAARSRSYKTDFILRTEKRSVKRRDTAVSPGGHGVNMEARVLTGVWKRDNNHEYQRVSLCARLLTERAIARDHAIVALA
jgi:hypothetical protein